MTPTETITPANLSEPTLFYDPPYERPIEDHFAWNLVKYLCPTAALTYQEIARTPAGPLWIDFVIHLDGRRYGFEIGDLSDTDDSDLTRYRDALLIGSGCLDVLYRLRASDVLHRLHDCLFIASRLDPDLFTPRARTNLRAIASQEAGCLTLLPPVPLVRIAYAAHPAPATDEPEDRANATQPHAGLELRRLTRTHAAGWLKDYDRALSRFCLQAHLDHPKPKTPEVQTP